MAIQWIRQWGCVCTLVAVSGAIASGHLTQALHGQERARATGGWQNSPPSVPPAPQRAPAVQQAFYQAQGGSGLPDFPADFGSGVGATARGSGGGGLPPYPNGAATAGGRSVSGVAQAAPQNLPPVLPPTSASAPPVSPAPVSSGTVSPRSLGGMPAGGNQLRAQPASAPSQSPPPQSNAPRNNQMRNNDLRPVDGQSRGGSDPRAAAERFATGLPYVTPAPRGRYATSPYRGPIYQTAAYTRSVPARLASTTPGPAATAAPVLPQYQQYQQPGIYPTAYQCSTPAPSIPSTGAVPGAYVPPTYTPNLTPGLYSPDNAGYRPLFSLGQENYNVLLGRGIVGQPTVYVPGQPIRNFMRYLSP